jgi:hypothetical protein
VGRESQETRREENKKGEESIFVNRKTGASGELSRKKYLDMKFITPTYSASNLRKVVDKAC